MPTGDRGDNLSKAIAHYQAALTVSTRAADPNTWARVHYDLASAWLNMPRGERSENLRKAIASAKAATLVFGEDEDMRQKLEVLRRAYEATPAAEAQPFATIPAAE
jgi:hypothetical protein